MTDPLQNLVLRILRGDDLSLWGLLIVCHEYSYLRCASAEHLGRGIRGACFDLVMKGVHDREICLALPAPGLCLTQAHGVEGSENRMNADIPWSPSAPFHSSHGED